MVQLTVVLYFHSATIPGTLSEAGHEISGIPAQRHMRAAYISAVVRDH